jgi:hypothetical protein
VEGHPARQGERMSAAKSAATRKQGERQRMRFAGFVLRQFWVHPTDWPRVSKYLSLVRERRHLKAWAKSRKKA